MRWMKQRKVKANLLIVAVVGLASGAHAGPANRTNTATSQPVPINLDGFGSPLPAVAGNGSDLQTFATGQLNFKEIEVAPEIGPVFNGVACAGCHSQPAIGGAGLFINEIRVRKNSQPGPVHIFAVDNMRRLGAQKQSGAPIFSSGIEAEPLGCQITSPGCQLSACQKEEALKTTFSPGLSTCDPTSSAFANGANCAVGRAATPVFGLGLVEAVSDSALIALAQNEPSAVRGTAKMVTESFTRTAHVARFGWKDDHAFLRGFSGDAYLNEMGITNPDNPTEVSDCALNQSQFGIVLQNGNDPEDTTGSDGRADIDRFSDFMRALAPPPQLPATATTSSGSQIFQRLGCASCHTPTLTTASNPASFIPVTTGGVPISSTLNSALAGKSFHPYSDFLLHDMGALGDGITSGSAGPTMMRTAPLWGIRAKSVYLHDGRANDIPTAISLHDGQARSAAQAFKGLSTSQQQAVISFLNSL